MRRVFHVAIQRLQQPFFGLYLVLLLACVPVVLKMVRADASTNEDAPANEHAAADEAAIAHGKYLVHHVAQCVECHTPRDAHGELLDAELLSGAAIPVVGPANQRPWASVSASLVGLGNYDESFVRYLLLHGRRPDGTRPKSPMPSFQLNDHDADAVIAYLKSLP